MSRKPTSKRSVSKRQVSGSVASVSDRRQAVTGSAARFAERARQQRRIWRDRVLRWGAAVLAVVGVVWLVMFSPVLALHEDEVDVVVIGDASVVDNARVADVLAAAEGTPLPRLDTVALRRSLLEVPGVRAASVSRAFPHGVVVTVVAREPVAAVSDPDGGVLLVDAEGVQVGRADVAPDALAQVAVPVDDPAALNAVLLVLDELPADVAAQVVGAGAESEDAVYLEMSDGTRVEWGSAEQNALKAAVLTTLRTSGPGGVQVYDVSAPTLPITRS